MDLLSLESPMTYGSASRIQFLQSGLATRMWLTLVAVKSSQQWPTDLDQRLTQSQIEILTIQGNLNCIGVSYSAINRYSREIGSQACRIINSHRTSKATNDERPETESLHCRSHLFPVYRVKDPVVGFQATPWISDKDISSKPCKARFDVRVRQMIKLPPQADHA